MKDAHNVPEFFKMQSSCDTMVHIGKRLVKLFKEVISWSKDLLDAPVAAVVAAWTTAFAASIKVVVAMQ